MSLNKGVFATIILFLSLSFWPHVGVAAGASLYLSPNSGSHTVGDTFSVGIHVSSSEQAMNAVSGILSFSQDRLEIVSFSKDGSIISLWVQEPVFSNGDGTVSFEGIMLDSGFVGSSGTVLTMTFRVKDEGSATVLFSSGSVLANDGEGSNLLSSMGSAQFELVAPVPVSKATVATAPAVMETVSETLSLITSSTHPDPDRWYASYNAQFVWPAQEGITAVRLLLDRNALSVPYQTYMPAVYSKEFTDLEDGTWYLHLRLRDENGWGQVSHFRFQIDTEKPHRFDMDIMPREDLTEPRVRFVLDAEDGLSGIKHYELQVDGSGLQVWHDDGSHIYETTTLGPGDHVLLAEAVDEAGNALANFMRFFIEALESPEIFYYPHFLSSGDMLTIKGLSYPGSQIFVSLQDEEGGTIIKRVKSDSEGGFTVAFDEPLSGGVYTVWADVIDGRGARSESPEKMRLVVEQVDIWYFAARSQGFLSLFLSILALLLFSVSLLIYARFDKRR